MSVALSRPLVADLRHGFQALRGNWLWFVLLGVGLLILGFVALGSVGITTLATAVFIGAILIIGGFAELIGTMWCREWSGFFSHLLSALLSIIVGMMFLRAPIGSLAALTLLLATLLMVGGIFKIVSAVNYRFVGWGWSLAGGLVDFLLGLLIWQEWPASALWVIGMYVGINLLFRGINWISLGLVLRKIPATATA
jgi:uncharacterized membrane protein HdeD (DUF308 family)